MKLGKSGPKKLSDYKTNNDHSPEKIVKGRKLLCSVMIFETSLSDDEANIFASSSEEDFHLSFFLSSQ